MANELKFEGSKPIDRYLKPLRIGEDISTLELSTNGARISGGLEVTGAGRPMAAEPLTTNNIRTPASSDMSIFARGDMRLHATTSNMYFGNYGSIMRMSGFTGAGFGMQFNSVLDDGDYCRIDTTTHGATTITTVDDDAEAADLIFNIDGYIDLNSASGENITLDSGNDIWLIPDGDAKIDKNTALTATGTAKGLHIDYDHTGISASGQTVTGIGLDIDMNCETVTHVGTVVQTGIDIDMVAAEDGTQTNVGIDITTSGADTNFGIKINNENHAIYDGTEADFINYSSANAAEYFFINTIADGVTTLGTRDDGGNIGNLHLAPNGKVVINSTVSEYAYFHMVNPYSRLRIFGYNQDDDYLQIDVEADGATTISTVDDDGNDDADLTLDVDGKITLDSATGEFEMHGGGTTAKFADMYAGMILGYRVVGLNEGHADIALTTSYVVPTDEFGVTFIVPPSGNVELSIQAWFSAGSSGQSLLASISSDNNTDGYTQIADEYEQSVLTAPARNSYQPVNFSWVLTGLTAGDSNTTYVAFKTLSVTGTPKILWGGSTTGRYPDFIMKATALPATIAT